jgi:hypothetical protein
MRSCKKVRFFVDAECCRNWQISIFLITTGIFQITHAKTMGTKQYNVQIEITVKETNGRGFTATAEIDGGEREIFTVCDADKRTFFK